MRNINVQTMFGLRAEFDNWCVKFDPQTPEDNNRIRKGRYDFPLTDFARLPLFIEADMLLSLLGLEDFGRVA